MQAQANSSRGSALRLISEPTGYSDLSEYELVLACQRHDQGAFTALYKRYLPHVKGMLMNLAPDWRNIHDDLIQETFVRVWKFSSSIKNPKAFKRWLSQLVTNVFYDQLRKRPRLNVISLDEPMRNNDEDSSSPREIPDLSSQPDESFERKETLKHIHAALELLPQQFKNVVVLREVAGLSYEEIAAKTGVELGTVKSRLARGKSKMQSHLRPFVRQSA